MNMATCYYMSVYNIILQTVVEHCIRVRGKGGMGREGFMGMTYGIVVGF